MPSLHDIMAKPAVAALVSQFGERGPDGDFLKLKYWLPSHPEGMEPLEFRGITGPVKSVIQLTVDGESRLETKVWHIERSLLDAAGILHPQRNARAEDADGRWSIDVSACVWEASFVTLALARAPRTAGNELRSASV